MQSHIEITKLNRGELLNLALSKLIAYKNENPDAVNEQYNFSHLPYELEDLADLVFLRKYRPLNGLFPSSHYICHVNKMITCVEQRLAQFKMGKAMVDPVIDRLGEELKLSKNDVTTLKKLAYVPLDDMPYAEGLSYTALDILKEKKLLECDLAQSNIAIKLIENALKLSINDESAGLPKRPAFLLAEMYANARKEVIGIVKFNPEKALFYLKEACEHGSATAKKLLSEKNPVMALLKENGMDINELSALCQLSMFAQQETQPKIIPLETTNTISLQ
ncbi:SEL1-like repeat protein [Legionella sp. WA2022007384]